MSVLERRSKRRREDRRKVFVASPYLFSNSLKTSESRPSDLEKFKALGWLRSIFK